MAKPLFLVSYTIKQMANILGVHPDTLRNWERDGLLVPHRINKRGDRRYTDEHIREVRDKGLIPNPQIQAAKRDEDYENYSKEQLIRELENLKKEKRFGLVWEEGEEEVIKRCKKDAPILARQAKKQISTDKEMPTNVFIEGDNYHALQMLNYTHRGQIDVIYIDPPYNTGKSAENGGENSKWLYNDKYVDGNDRFRHSKWLNMMNPRLKLAKNLLSTKGVIFISIDDNEQAHLKVLCDEVFGEENFIANFVWNSTKSITNPALVSLSHNYNYCYAKDKTIFDSSYRKNFKLPPILSGFSNPDNDPRGDWKADPFEAGGFRKNQMYEIVNPKTGEKFYPNQGNCWKNDHAKYLELVKDKRIVFGKDGKGRPQRKRFLWEAKERGLTPNTWWDDVGTTTNGTMELKGILGNSNFPNPKPTSLILKMLTIASLPDSTILDFFAGSGTTGHAVMELNKLDGGNRKFILCTNNENHNGKNAGGIAETVCYPRIKKIIEGYQKNANGGGQVAGLGGNLEYFNTDFVDVENIKDVSDKKKLEFTHKAGELLALKESCFNEVERNEYYQIFTDGAGKFVGVYFRGTMEKLKELDKKLLDKPNVRMYIFSYNNGYAFQARYAECPNVGIESIPEPILRVYQEVNL